MTKQFTLTLLAIALLSSSAVAQTPQQPLEANLYYRALFAGLDKMSKSYGNNYHHVIVQKERGITDGLPSQLGEHRVEYLDSQGLIDRYKKLRKEFPILVARPMKNEGERLNITFTVWHISYTKGRLNYAVSDWVDAYFRYDCEKREYVIDEVKLGGI
jgi:hypothetical protein